MRGGEHPDDIHHSRRTAQRHPRVRPNGFRAALQRFDPANCDTRTPDAIVKAAIFVTLRGPLFRTGLTASISSIRS
jgi:hypothetical protein